MAIIIIITFDLFIFNVCGEYVYLPIIYVSRYKVELEVYFKLLFLILRE